jgi:hypothetical protein
MWIPEHQDLQLKLLSSIRWLPAHDVMWILNRHPKLLHEAIEYEKIKKMPLEFAESFKIELEDDIEHGDLDELNFSMHQGALADLRVKIPMIKLLLWKSNFKKAYQEDKVRLLFKQTAPALDAIIIGYLVEPCKPSRQQIQNNQKQLKKK